jgi:hypothetical protein
VAGTGGQQRTRLFDGLSLHTPFFNARDQHSGMK